MMDRAELDHGAGLQYLWRIYHWKLIAPCTHWVVRRQVAPSELAVLYSWHYLKTPFQICKMYRTQI